MRVGSLAVATLALLLSSTACILESDPWLEVIVSDRGRPVAAVQVTVRTQQPQSSTRTVQTDSRGTARLEPGTSGRVIVEALLVDEDRAWFATRELTVGLGRTLRLALESDFEQGPAVRAFERSSGDEPALHGARFCYELPELKRDRQVSAVLEIDRVQGLPELPLVALTQGGPIHLEDVFAAVGITLNVTWSDRIPATILGVDPWPGQERLVRIMTHYRNVPAAADQWHLYVLLVPRPQPTVELSMMIEPATRSGVVVCVDLTSRNPGEIVHAIAHEIGHLLNLPHPWETYGDTRSIMTYPWRWSDWDWSDPSVYRFDAPGRHHILRGPEPEVRSGAGPFSPPLVCE